MKDMVHAHGRKGEIEERQKVGDMGDESGRDTSCT